MYPGVKGGVSVRNWFLLFYGYWKMINWYSFYLSMFLFLKPWKYLCQLFIVKHNNQYKDDCLANPWKIDHNFIQELSSFENVFTFRALNGLKDNHLWFSLRSHPVRSHFTSVQRVSCAFALLLSSMLVNVMWYGVAEQANDQDRVAGMSPYYGFTIHILCIHFYGPDRCL